MILATFSVRPPVGPAKSSTKMKRFRGEASTPAGGSDRNFFAGGKEEGEEDDDRAGAVDGAFTSAGGAPPPGMHAAFQALLLRLFLPLPLPLPFPLGFGQCFHSCPIWPQLKQGPSSVLLRLRLLAFCLFCFFC